jgi:hypothetical protein
VLLCIWLVLSGKTASSRFILIRIHLIRMCGNDWHRYSFHDYCSTTSSSRRWSL